MPSPWSSTDRTWTHSQLERERADFFETRVTGRPEVWAALKNVSELLRQGELATAQGILEAAGVTLPTGSLIEGSYDEAGNLYRLPAAVLLEPTNVLLDDTQPGHERQANGLDTETITSVGYLKGAPTGTQDVDNDTKEEEDAEVAERRREEKGKGSERDAVRVTCRLSDRGGPDVVVLLGKTQNVSVLARRVREEADVSCLEPSHYQEVGWT